MAFSGLHVVCGFAGSQIAREKSQPIFGKIAWIEAPSSGVTSTNFAPPVNDAMGQAIFRIRAAADSWVSVGPSPNATSGTRFLVPASTDYDVFAEPGDKFQWVAA
ncbi:hypothetical protein GGE45_002712 [Rhizobium aethiopicum]|uniref:hypothetical protein n=1 Tax=Rhizobium aethiopicum TaxID=1138170 RepID=UPI00161E211B|nr:hypothetical protein [Rhizobium aethiopicum]MBB4580382.1 hypothetical protein [Rhizobium aethiopicum]